MQIMPVSALKFHPQNGYFFDNIEGQKWQEFLESVRTSGIISPITISGDGIIVSGHQRVRACLELDIPNIVCEVRIYEDPDKLLKDLLETNIRQRGVIDNTLKMGRIVRELERIYGIDELSRSEAAETREKIAAMMGKERGSIYKAKRLTTFDYRIQEAIEAGQIAATVAALILPKFTETQEEQLALALPAIPVWQKKQLEAFLYLLQTDPEKVQTLQQSDYKGLEELLASPTLNVTVEAAPDEIETLRAKVKETETALKAKEAAIQGAEEALKEQSDAFDQERAMAARNLEKQVQRAYVAEEKAARLTNGKERQEFIDRIKRLESDVRQHYERAQDLAKKNKRLSAQLEQEATPISLPSVDHLDELGLSTLLAGFMEALSKFAPMFENADAAKGAQYCKWLLEASEAIDDAYKLCDSVQIKRAG